jgi:hypothetical protein
MIKFKGQNWMSADADEYLREVGYGPEHKYVVFIERENGTEEEIEVSNEIAQVIDLSFRAGRNSIREELRKIIEVESGE